MGDLKAREQEEALIKFSLSVMRFSEPDYYRTYFINLPSFDFDTSKLLRLWLREFKHATDKRSRKKNVLTEKERLWEFLHLWVKEYAPTLSQKEQYKILDALKHWNMGAVNRMQVLFLKNQNVSKKLHHRPRTGSFSKLERTRSIDVIKQLKKKRSLRESKPKTILSHTPLTIAKQLTKYEWTFFRELKQIEFLDLRWNKEGKSPALNRLFSHFSDTCQWVQGEILLATTKNQVSLLKKFIKIGQECLQLNNFNSTMEILSALNSHNVRRLSHIWQKLPSKLFSQYEKMDQLMSPCHNFSKYRERLHTAKPPVLPYMGIYTRDLTYIYTGNKKFKETKSGWSVNRELLGLVSQHLEEIRWFQSHPYEYEEDPKFHSSLSALLKTASAYDEDYLLHLSFQVKPSLVDLQETDLSSIFNGSDEKVDTTATLSARKRNSAYMKTIKNPYMDEINLDEEPPSLTELRKGARNIDFVVIPNTPTDFSCDSASPRDSDQSLTWSSLAKTVRRRNTIGGRSDDDGDSTDSWYGKFGKSNTYSFDRSFTESGRLQTLKKEDGLSRSTPDLLFPPTEDDAPERCCKSDQGANSLQSPYSSSTSSIGMDASDPHVECPVSSDLLTLSDASAPCISPRCDLEESSDAVQFALEDISIEDDSDQPVADRIRENFSLWNSDWTPT